MLLSTKTYKDWLDTSDTNWMIDPEFFMGRPTKTEVAPIDALMRASVYKYIEDTFGGRRLSLRNADRWAQLYRARLTEVNGTFWKQIQLDMLLRANDMATADYEEFSQDFNRNSQTNKSENTGINESKSTGHNLAKSKTDPVQTTVTDRTTPGKQTTTHTPVSAAQSVQLQSELAESTYQGAALPGSPTYTNGMPTLDTTHGSNVGGAWQLSEGTKDTVEVSTPTGNMLQEQSVINNTNEGVNSDASTSSNASAAFMQAVNDSISGSHRKGSHDYNGYNLTASIEALQALLPYNFLYSALAPLFSGMVEVLDEEGNNLWL